MSVSTAVNIDDLRKLAKRHLPRIAFDYIEGGVDGEECLARNEYAFQAYRLLPRYFVDVSKRSQTANLFGQNYDSPFGICPTGMAGLWRHETDLILARAAVKANIPFILSSASNCSIEQIAAVAPDNVWFQLYGARDRQLSKKFLHRVRDLGIKTVVVTVDCPVSSKRERNIKNGFGRPLKLSARTIMDGLCHPAWLVGFLRHGGIPKMANWLDYLEPGARPETAADLFASQTPAPDQTWEDLERFRELWPHNLVIKGILNPKDAAMAVSKGVDGIIVSNHGGRQLDWAPSPLAMLPAIREVVGQNYTVMFDSGIRRGSDIITALCLGANFTFVGRATLYGTVAGGQPGADLAIDLLRKEAGLVMGQIGCSRVEELGPDFIVDAFPKH